MKQPDKAPPKRRGDNRTIIAEPGKTVAVRMEDVRSMEHYQLPDGTVHPVLDGVSLRVIAGESWGIIGNERFALGLLLEIIGNVKPHEAGRCALMEVGMMRQKRRILPHVYYINDQSVRYGHMTVLDYLMFASAKFLGSGCDRQILFLELLLRTDLYGIALSYIHFLSPAERMLVTMLLASQSPAQMVVADFSRVPVPRTWVGAFGKVVKEMRDKQKTVILGTVDPQLVQRSCTHAALLHAGTIRVSDTIAALCNEYDHRLLTVFTFDAEAALSVIRARFPLLRILQEPGKLFLYGAETDAFRSADVTRALTDAGVRLEGVIFGEKTLYEVVREVGRTLC